MKTLGLDISSSTIGWALLDENKTRIKLIDSGYIKPLASDKGSLFERLSQTKIEIGKLLDKYEPDNVAIEDIAFYMKGKSNANTIIILATFNRMIGLYCYEFLNKEPQMISVLSIRNSIKNYLNLEKTPEKEEIPSAIEKILNKKFEWRFNKKGKIIKENYDIADGIAVGISSILLERLKRREIIK